MATKTLTFETNAAQTARIKKAMEWRAHRTAGGEPDPNNVPGLDAAGVMSQAREIFVQFFNSEVRAELADLQRAQAAVLDDANEIE